MPRLTIPFDGTPDEDHVGRVVKLTSAGDKCELVTAASDLPIGVVVTIDGDQYGVATTGEYCFARVEASATIAPGTTGFDVAGTTNAGIIGATSGDVAVGFLSPRTIPAAGYSDEELVEIFVCPHVVA